MHWLLCGCWVACCCRKKSRYRAIPGTFGQFNLLVRRAGVKWVRNWGVKFLDVCLFAAAALIIGGHLFPFLNSKVKPAVHIRHLRVMAGGQACNALLQGRRCLLFRQALYA